MGFIYTNVLIPELQRFPFLHRTKVLTSFFQIKSLFLLSRRSLVGELWLVYSPIWWTVEGVLYPTGLHIDTATSNSRPGPSLSWNNKGTSQNWPGKSLSVHFPDQLCKASRWQCAEAKWILKTVVLTKVRLGVLTLGTGTNGCCLPLCGTLPGIDMNVQTVSASH